MADIGNNRIQKFTSSGSYITKWGTLGSGDGEFDGPIDVAVDGAGIVYVTDVGNSRIQMFTSSGAYLARWGRTGSGNGEFYGPYGVAADASGNVYVTDLGNNRVQKFGSGTTSAGRTTWGRLKSLYR